MSIKEFTIEKIDEKNFKKIDTREEVTILNIDLIKKQKDDLESEVARLNNELAEINIILDEYQKSL